MRILQLGKFYPIRGGVEKVMWDLTRGLSANGLACDMLCARLPGDGVDDKDRLLYDEGSDTFTFPGGGRVFCVKAMAKKAATMISPAMVKWLRKHAGEYGIIHIHHPDPMAALALRLSGYKGKVVLHWHSDILSQQFLLRLYKPLQSWLIRRANVIVGTTPVYLRESPFLKDVQGKCKVVPIGIEPVPDAPEAAAALRSSYEGRTILLSVGRLVPYKGYSHLVKMMRYLPEEICLVIGGTGPLRESLENQIAENGLGNRVRLLGYVPDNELPAWFHICDAFILGSVMKTEAFGIVQVEAMSCGKPVVATIIPGSGVSWVNRDGISGLNASPGDARSMADAVMAVLKDKEKYGSGALGLYRKEYSFQSMINKMTEIYENL